MEQIRRLLALPMRAVTDLFSACGIRAVGRTCENAHVTSERCDGMASFWDLGLAQRDFSLAPQCLSLPWAYLPIWHDKLVDSSRSRDRKRVPGCAGIRRRPFVIVGNRRDHVDWPNVAIALTAAILETACASRRSYSSATHLLVDWLTTIAVRHPSEWVAPVSRWH